LSGGGEEEKEEVVEEAVVAVVVVVIEVVVVEKVVVEEKEEKEEEKKESEEKEGEERPMLRHLTGSADAVRTGSLSLSAGCAPPAPDGFGQARPASSPLHSAASIRPDLNLYLN